MAVAGNKPIPVERFAGLNLQDDPLEIGWNQAVDLLNVDFDYPGVARSRDGAHGWFESPTASRNYFFLHPYNGATNRYLVAARVNDAGTDNIFEAIGTTPSIAVTSGALPSNPVGAVSIGTATATYSYFTFDQVTDVWRFDGTTFAAAAGVPDALVVGATPWDNRLVVGCTTNGTSRVEFSDPGAPGTFTANNYVDLTPGDGEFITAMATWGEYLFVWKQTKGFVFYGTSVDSAGSPIFNYRPLCTGLGPRGFQQGITAGEKGVYIVDPDRGVYVTRGGEPRLVSRQITPIFRRQSLPYWNKNFLGAPDGVSWSLRAAQRRVYFTYNDSSLNSVGTLVYHEDDGYWTFYDLSDGRGFCEFQASAGRYDTFYVQAAGAENVMRFRSGYDGDQDYGSTSQALTSSLTSGFLAPAGPGVESTVRETEFTGIGNIQFAWGRDTGSLDALSTVALSGSVIPQRTYHRVSKAGENLRWKITDSSGGAWSLNRMCALSREARGAGEKTT